jgi:hypothetical protein
LSQVLDPGITGQPHALLKVRAAVAGEEFGEGGGREEHLIPYVHTIVPMADVAQRESQGRRGAACLLLATFMVCLFNCKAWCYSALDALPNFAAARPGAALRKYGTLVACLFLAPVWVPDAANVW